MIDFDFSRRKLVKTRYVYIGETGRYGLGIFAARPFRQGEVIVADQDGDYYADPVSEAQARRLGFDLSAHCFQIGEDRYLLPHGSIDDLINHCCEPTAGIRLNQTGYFLLALQDVQPGQELTYDYSTYISNPRETLDCGCGSASCRGRIGPFGDLPALLPAYYLERDVVGGFAVADAASRVATAA